MGGSAGDYSFTHYLLAKQTVDDRALNRHVIDQPAKAAPASD